MTSWWSEAGRPDVAAAKNSAKTILVEAGPMFGGELLTGMSVDNALYLIKKF